MSRARPELLSKGANERVVAAYRAHMDERRHLGFLRASPGFRGRMAAAERCSVRTISYICSASNGNPRSSSPKIKTTPK